MTRANFALQPNAMPVSIAYSIVDTVRKLSGISVDPENAGFLELRINRRVRELGLPNLAEYLSILNGPAKQIIWSRCWLRIQRIFFASLHIIDFWNRRACLR